MWTYTVLRPLFLDEIGSITENPKLQAARVPFLQLNAQIHTSVSMKMKCYYTSHPEIVTYEHRGRKPYNPESHTSVNVLFGMVR